MSRRIAFLNYKGGVGKTSLIVNIAACLAQMGHRVLLCDFDTQSNASIWLLRLERWNRLVTMSGRTVFSLFQPDAPLLADLIVRDVVVDREGRSVLPGLDLLPTSFNLVDLEADFVTDPSKPAYLLFREQLAEVEKDYDFILFDCPPNVLRASQCGVFAATEIYVPANPDALSLIGFTLLVEKLTGFQDASVGFRRFAFGHAAQVEGIILNAVKANTDVEVPKMRMQLRLNQSKPRGASRATPRFFPPRFAMPPWCAAPSPWVFPCRWSPPNPPPIPRASSPITARSRASSSTTPCQSDRHGRRLPPTPHHARSLG